MTTRVSIVRTTSFRLSRENFGRVHIYKAGSRFSRVWGQLEERWRRDGDAASQRKLPYRGLATALRVLSGDFVALQRRLGSESAFLISRRPIGRDELAIAVGAWEAYALGMPGRPITKVLDDLTETVVEVGPLIHQRPGRCPTISDDTRWVWDVAVWELAHQLVSQPLQTESGIATLRVDSNATLLTWDRLVSPDNSTEAGAMHKVVLKLMTVPGIEEPIVSLQSSLVRLAPSWRATAGAKYAWADIGGGAPILVGKVHTRRVDDGFVTDWDDLAAQVLRGASLRVLPDAVQGPTLEGPLRAGYPKQPRSHRIGRGVGSCFHECVSHHARDVFGSHATCLTLEASRLSWPTQKRVAARPPMRFESDAHERTFCLLVVYANSSVRRRVRDALVDLLADGAHEEDQAAVARFRDLLLELPDGRLLHHGPLKVKFVSPPGSETWLLQRNSQRAIETWFISWFHEHCNEDEFSSALVQTTESAAFGRDQLADPKHVLRAAFARKGIVTQFITKDSEPSASPRRRRAGLDPEDHAALNASADMMRNAGYFLRPFPELGGGHQTIVVGIYATRATKKTTGRAAAYLVNMVAVSLGTSNAWGYIERAGWVPLAQATAWFHATDQILTIEEAPKRVERAVGQLRLALADHPAVLLFDALGCRRFWACLADKADGRVDPWMRQHRTAVVRVRASLNEVPRPAGTGDWERGFSPAKYTDFRPMFVKDAPSGTPWFLLSGSAVMSQGQNARRSSRFGASPRGLREDWHSLGTTELMVLEQGVWQREALVAQVAILCRIAPTWDRTLRWPSPLHLARAIVRDHPHDYFSEEDDEEGTGAADDIRFDFGIY